MPAKSSSSSGSDYFHEPKTNARTPSAGTAPGPAGQPTVAIDMTHYATVRVTKKIVGRVEK